MYILDATIEFIINITFFLQATAMFTEMHDSILKTHMLKKIFVTQDRIFDCVMRKHEEKVIFKMKILKENLVLKLSCMKLCNSND